MIQRLRASRVRIFRTIGLLSASGAAAATAGAVFYCLSTRGQTFHTFDQTHDPLARGPFGHAYNPYSNKSLSDIYRVRVPLSDVRPDLLEDFKRGGSRLIERYCSGVLGGWGFATQRYLSKQRAKKTASLDPDQLYTRAQILDSDFRKGTKISDHFEVIEKTPTSILFRGGSPSNADGLRKVDVLIQGLVEVSTADDVATLSLKCVFYDGTELGAPTPLPEWLTPLHLLYARALAANGTANCRW